MSKRVGCVLVFREGTRKEDAVAALTAIQDMLDLPQETWQTVSARPGKGTFQKVPFKMEALVQEYNDEYGGPVWYIP